MARQPSARARQYDVDPETGCWMTRVKATKKGYGWHRWFYEQKYGPVPEGKELAHTCRRIGCVNPDHLEPMTRLEHEEFDRGKTRNFSAEERKRRGDILRAVNRRRKEATT